MLGGLLEVGGPCIIDVHVFLGIAVGQREPAALHLHHDAVAAAEGMADVGHGVIDFLHLAGRERLGFFVAVAEAAAHQLPAHELLVAAHLYAFWVWIGIGEIVGIHIDQ